MVTQILISITMMPTATPAVAIRTAEVDALPTSALRNILFATKNIATRIAYESHSVLPGYASRALRNTKRARTRSSFFKT